MGDALIELQERGFAVGRHHSPAEQRWLRRQVARGAATAVLPGVFVAGDHGDDLTVLAQAASARYPDAVVVGGLAAHLTYWPSLVVDRVELAHRRIGLQPERITFTARRIDPDHIVEVQGLRCLVPAVSALDLAAATDGESIDQALRRRATSLEVMSACLGESSYRAGNRERARWLLDSRTEPWSRAEREAHRLLRAAGITGWTANFATAVGGQAYYVDIAFPGKRLVIEIDGRQHHSDQHSFEADRRRQNDLVGAGWTVLRFTWAMLVNEPEYCVECVRKLLRER